METMMMSEDAMSAPVKASVVATVSPLKRLLRAISRIICRSQQRRALAELDARLLRDIGRSREEARREAAKPGWRR
jgi:uncharacterized protein YjiS (DUF1127 family)